MSVEDAAIVDFIGVDTQTGQCVLTISDYLPWSDQEHLILLQEKLNRYLAFIESGEIVEEFSEANGREIRIDVVLKYEPDDGALSFLEEAQRVVSDAGLTLTWGRLESGA